ncbi:MAG: hypothetical protein IK088_02380 [Lachnospiraceae bacterium]|nr:hypothetical protein [Lachnospiraceae bacterium]
MAESDCSGLFQYTRSPAVIKDLRLKNSYFESAYNAVGSIAGDGGGEFTNISSEAILNGTKSAHGYGGIVGRVNDGSSAEISFSWFSGRITVAEGSVTQQHGGILGQVLNDASVEINHCLFTGSIHADRTYGAANVGGILGIALGYKYGDRIWKPYVTISDCFADGTIEAKGGLDGAILGQSGAESHVAIRNSYGTRETSPLLVGGVNAHKNDYSEDGAVYPAGDITGAKAYAWLDLDFERVWACTALTPRLRIVTPSDQFVTTEGIAKIDTSWYDKNSSVFTIVNAEQLRSLKKVSGSEDFENKTIKLGADILLNEDWENYASYGTAPPENVWEPLYSPSRPFRGTFDGQGHAIKGLYIRSDQEYTGLFAEAWGTFRNLRFVNGWIECTGESRLGVIAGRASGTFEQIYTNCILKGAKTTDHYFIGGLVGQVTWNDSVFREVWSEVQIDMKNANAVGGIIGAANANKNAPISVEIRDCLFTGSIRIDQGAGIGGFVGQIINNNDVVTMTVSCGLSAGELFVSSDGSGLGSIVGMVGGSQKTDVERTYYVKGSAVLKEAPAGGIGSVSGILSGTYAEREKENLCGVSGYDNTMLDFTNAWAAVENDVPHLQIFTDGFELIDVSERERFDTSWYDPAADSYWIGTAEQLKYLAEQSKTADFNGKAIILTDDIVFNTDHASYLNYGESAPKRVWPVFGSDSLPFAGTIEGGGHTIYGLYASAGAGEPTGFISRMAETAKVRNLKILDAYFETAEEKKGIGVLSGIASGTIDRVYIDAILKTTGGSTYVGGIAGLAEHLSVSGTTFAGTVKGTNEKSIGYGGLIGGIDGTASRLTLTDVCFSGEVSLVKRAAYLGGLIGRQNAGKAEITGALVSGSVVNEKSNGTHTGSVFGYVRKNDMKAKNVYAVKGAATTSVVIGNGSVDGGVTELPESSLLGTNAKTSTGLDFEAHWETVEAGLPILQPIKECDLSPDIADTRWFDPSMTTYTLRTINELIGLSKLSEFNDFGGKVIRLANDLVLNEDHKNFASWGGTAPKYSFTPIGAKTYAASASNGFKGTFDGQGHAIMGLYTKTAEDMRGGLFNITKDAVIKNVRLVDCYFESSGTERFGAFAGIGSGTFENLYTNAVVNSTYADAYSVAGFVGQGWGLTFRNCWFDGRVVKKGSACAAAFVGMTTEAEPILIENCLVTGNAETDLTASGANLAGFLAYSFNRQSSVTIKNSLFAGKVLCAELTENSGSVIGRMDRPLDSELLITLENVYAVENGAGNSRTIGTAASEGVIISGSVTEVPLSSILGDSASSALPGLDFTVFYPRENDVPGLNP